MTHPGRWPFLLSRVLGVSLLVVLAGCATPPGGSQEGAYAGLPSSDWQSKATDPAARNRAQTHMALATGYLQRGEYRVALSEAQQALQADPSYAAAFNVSGMAYAALDDKTQAAAAYQRALALNPRDSNVHHNFGWLQCEEGHYAEAETQFEQALALPNADRARTLMAQGVCQARAGKKAEAEATLMRSYQLDAGNPITGYNLALLLYQRGDYERAHFYIQRLNDSKLANAQSLWLGMKVEHRLNNQSAVAQLGSQLSQRFPGSNELLAYQKGNFNE